MKTRIFLLTTALGASFAFNAPVVLAAETITTGTVLTATKPATNAQKTNPRIAAASFVEHVNFARVALAMKNKNLAKQHITQARDMIALIKTATTEKQIISRVESGRIVYQYDTAYKYHYFPIETGPVEVKKVSSGPVWAKNDLAVTEADIVYLTLDLTKDNTNTYLKASESAIAGDNLKEADNQLAMLTDAVVTVDSQESVPSDKAHDNIELARHFITGKNYEGARFSLKHADDALDEMQSDNMYTSRRRDIIAMRKDVSTLQDHIAKKDPTMIDKANKKMEVWWNDLKTWSETKS
jgi:hypothetical protein